MTASPLSPQDRVAIEHDCERLVRRYALLVDAGDYDRLAGLFAEDASFARPTDPDNPIVGRDAIMAGFRKRPAGRVTRHIVASCVVEAESADSASGVSYLMLYQGPQTEGDVAQIDKPVLIGAFEDRFVRQDGQWKFQARQGSLALKTAD